MTSDQQRDTNTRQHYKDLSNEIADILLGPDSPVRGSTEFDELISELEFALQLPFRPVQLELRDPLLDAHRFRYDSFGILKFQK